MMSLYLLDDQYAAIDLNRIMEFPTGAGSTRVDEARINKSYDNKEYANNIQR